MDLKVRVPNGIKSGEIQITGSKSETNRLLLLQALFKGLILNNTSNSDDSVVMTKALSGNDEVVDIHHAGTAMRFLTAYFSIQEGRTVVLTGSQRMKERPIKILVEALRQLGASIVYVENEGYPPIKIEGKKITAHKIAMPADVSSQYISALLLIASVLENGMEIELVGKITSIPYIKMTLALLEEIGVKTAFEGNIIRIFKTEQNFKPITDTLVVESDWSSASYFFSIVALAKADVTIQISSYKPNSLQGDSALVNLYAALGVESVFDGNKLVLSKKKGFVPKAIQFDLNNTPDVAQTIAVTCFGLGIACELTGLHTLKIKETDRLEALKTELSKLGASIDVSDDTLWLKERTTIHPNVHIATYNDHRMAMAFAPLAIVESLIIDDAEVVSKSYPDFWRDMEILGFTREELN
ncbi:MAG: 3-phosphoshikimate 1-carboxyvinyltransferase [Flavobacteriales bacterium]|nr:3-phosphoshikimate 1-carboxyvinyltransferase [Flavobacteriales bacterium]